MYCGIYRKLWKKSSIQKEIYRFSYGGGLKKQYHISISKVLNRDFRKLGICHMSSLTAKLTENKLKTKWKKRKKSKRKTMPPPLPPSQRRWRRQRSISVKKKKANQAEREKKLYHGCSWARACRRVSARAPQTTCARHFYYSIHVYALLSSYVRSELCQC